MKQRYWLLPDGFVGPGPKTEVATAAVSADDGFGASNIARLAQTLRINLGASMITPKPIVMSFFFTPSSLFHASGTTTRTGAVPEGICKRVLSN